MIIIDGAKECSLQPCLLILPSLSLLLASLLVASILQELLDNGLGSRAHLLQGFFGEDRPRSALSFLSLSRSLLFGVALSRRLRLGQPAGFGQDLQSLLRQLVFAGLEQLGCLQNSRRLASSQASFRTLEISYSSVSRIDLRMSSFNALFSFTRKHFFRFAPRGTNEMKSISISPKSNSWDMQTALPDAEGLMIS